MSPFISWELEAANPLEVKPGGGDARKTGGRKGGAFVMDYMQMDYMCGRLKEEDDRPPPSFPEKQRRTESHLASRKTRKALSENETGRHVTAEGAPFLVAPGNYKA